MGNHNSHLVVAAMAPSRASSRSTKGTHKGRTADEAELTPQRSRSQKKKARKPQSSPTRRSHKKAAPIARKAKQDEAQGESHLQDEAQGESQGESQGHHNITQQSLSPPPSAQNAPPPLPPPKSPLFVSSDNEEEEEEEEAKPTKFLAVWKAVYGVNMKEIVPGSSRAFQSSTEELLFMDIVDWKTDLLKKLGQNYKVVSLYTVASYQGSKTDEQLRSDLACLLDLIAMFAILTEWRGRWPSKSLTLSVILQLQEEVALAAVAAAPPPTQTPQSTQRRSATATQEAALAYIYGTEAATDDIGKMMNREWQCKNRDCKNMSKTC